MNRISFPLKLQMKNDSVKLLHERFSLFGFDIDRKETAGKRFGASTQKAVVAFQKENCTKPKGNTDDRIAIHNQQSFFNHFRVITKKGSLFPETQHRKLRLFLSLGGPPP